MLHEYVGRPELNAAQTKALADVFWLGGSSCSGKTTIARMLADRHGLRVYHCDDHFHEHAGRVDPARHPYFNRIKDLSPEELLMRPADAQAAELYGFYDEELEMVVEDLLAMPGSGPVLAEGAGLRPRSIVEVIGRPRRAIWLAASSELRRKVHSGQRAAMVNEILAKCPNPKAALENWLARDELRAQTLREELRELDLTCLAVDGARSLEANARTVAKHFGLGHQIEADRPD